jgi:signal transduction histidine kinase
MGAATNLLNLLIPLLIITVILVLVLSFFMFYSHRQKVLSTMKMDFVNSMTHEMKTPIASISLASQMMNDPSVGNTVEKMQRFAGVITNESKRLNTLIEQLLYTLVLDRKKTVLTFENLDVNKMLGSVIDNFSVKVDCRWRQNSVATECTKCYGKSGRCAFDECVLQFNGKCCQILQRRAFGNYRNHV